eukprot:348204-Rhodomonas_salina.3
MAACPSGGAPSRLLLRLGSLRGLASAARRPRLSASASSQAEPGCQRPEHEPCVTPLSHWHSG